MDAGQLVDEVARRLALRPQSVARPDALAALEASIGAPPPELLREWLLRLGATDSASLEFGGEVVLFSDIDEIRSDTADLELEGKGVVPLGHDFFGSIWLLRTSRADPFAGGAVLLVPVQERYADPENPVEHLADSFQQFLAGLTNTALQEDG